MNQFSIIQYRDKVTHELRRGRFIRQVKHRPGYNGVQMTIVKFYGSMGKSRVPLDDVVEIGNLLDGITGGT